MKIKKLLLLSCIGLVALNVQAQIQDYGRPKAACTTLTLEDMLPKGLDTANTRNAANNDLLWDNGEVIKVKFMNNIGSKSILDYIMNYAKSWEKFANIKFQFVNDDAPETNVRILLGSTYNNLGHNSQLGINSNDVSQTRQTLNLDTSDFINYDYYVKDFKAAGPFYNWVKSKRSDLTKYTGKEFVYDVIYYPGAKQWNFDVMRGTTTHEFGHALGLLHEQSYPDGIKWNKDTVYKYYAKYQGWDKKKTDFNVLGVSEAFYTNGTSYDPKSIMHYPVYAWQTIDGYSVGENNTMSDGDKKLIKALYPKDQKISSLAVPIIRVSDATAADVKVDNVRKGLVITPHLTVKTNAVLGLVVFVARLTTEDGMYYIPTKDQDYNLNGNAATFAEAKLLPSSKTTYNKDGKNKIELFFPFSGMPDIAGKNIKVEFAVFQKDKVNNRLQKVVIDALSTPISLPTTLR